MKIGVVGASGYSGGELLRLLSNHPTFDVEYIAAGSSAGALVTDIHPHLLSYAGRSSFSNRTFALSDFRSVQFASQQAEVADFRRIPNGPKGRTSAASEFRRSSILEIPTRPY